MKTKLIILGAIVILFFSTNVFAAEGHGQHEDKGSMMEHKGSMMGHMEEGVSTAIEVGNKICPVSGEKVGGMGPAIKVAHNGKTYNLCCQGCVAMFQADPEKYVKIIEESMGQQNVKGESHDHSKHVMGEMEPHAMKDMHSEQESHSKIVDEDRKNAKGEVQEVQLEAYQFGYSPESIVISKGDVVRIRATSRDVPHGIFIKEYGINTTVKKGVYEEIEFVADKAGEFDIICSVYCGRGHHSMKGKLIVKE